MSTSKRDPRVDLVGVAEVLHEHLTGALVASAFEELRNGHRRRAWTLERMVEFWTAVIMRAPPSLSHALREACAGRGSPYPQVGTSKQAFFKRSSQLSWEFFASIFRAFTESVRSSEPAQFASHHEPVARRFARILVLDRSNLDPVARRLKVLQENPAAPVPGAVLGCYDLMRGTLADLQYSPSPKSGELTLARNALDRLDRGSLLIGDRQYGSPKFLAEVGRRGFYGLFRRSKLAKVEKIKCLASHQIAGATIEDWEIVLGKAAQLPARLVTVHDGKNTFEYITNVMDPEALSAPEIVSLYKDRWQIERMFYDIKVVLNLKRFYCGNANAVAMQLFAAAIVHTCMRTAQGRIAEQVGVEPENLSEEKLFPMLAATSATLTVLESGFLATELANPDVKLTKPDWRSVCCEPIDLKQILADKTRDQRKRAKPTSDPRRKSWQELPAPPGARRNPD